MMVWVSEMSSRARRRWKRTRCSAPSRMAGGEAGELDVHVVGGPSHETHGGLGDAGEAAVPPVEIRHGPRNHVAHVDELACRGISDQTFLGKAVLAIVDPRQGTRGLGEGGMSGDVVHALVIDPDDAPGLAKTLEELLAGPCAHGEDRALAPTTLSRTRAFPSRPGRSRDMLPE